MIKLGNRNSLRQNKKLTAFKATCRDFSTFTEAWEEQTQWKLCLRAEVFSYKYLILEQWCNSFTKILSGINNCIMIAAITAKFIQELQYDFSFCKKIKRMKWSEWGGKNYMNRSYKKEKFSHIYGIYNHFFKLRYALRLV